ncbi:hypothetical protein BDV3_000579 [Batrachochytrium dendrobatidis]|uniref:Uncharacterized protein n=1 Tax=Batrachochytrium dendrobatidis (strain JEL423) TaxID=403673 RepID=A0A177WD44_BATDL|nr:hypothetical protein BDEG_21607 [Batrachochytrium dendrobatidis JEL423]
MSAILFNHSNSTPTTGLSSTAPTHKAHMSTHSVSQPTASSIDPVELERVFSFFTTRALVVPWHIYDHLAIHLTADILVFILTKWHVLSDAPILRAGFLLGLLSSPRKRFPADLKLPADKLIELGRADPHPYVRLVGDMLSTWVSNGYINSTCVLQIPELSSGLYPLRQKLSTIQLFPKVLVFISHIARKHSALPFSRPASAISSTPISPTSTSTLASNEVFTFKPEYAIRPLHERIAEYGIDLTQVDTSMSHNRSSSGKSPLASTPLGIRKRPNSNSAFLRPAQRLATNTRRFSHGFSFSTSSTGSPHASSPGAITPVRAKGFQKESKIKMIDIEQAVDIEKIKTEAQKKIEDDAQAEKMRKARERDKAAQARREAKELTQNERRMKRAKLDEERKAKLEFKDKTERKLKVSASEDSVDKPICLGSTDVASDNDEDLFNAAAGIKKRGTISLGQFSQSPKQSQSLPLIDPPSVPAPAPAPAPDPIQNQPSFNTPKIAFEDVICGSTDLSPEDSNLIQDFLLGRYLSTNDTIREIKLNEHVYDDPTGVRKRESMWIILDYKNCKWRKVKRTVRINVVATVD